MEGRSAFEGDLVRLTAISEDDAELLSLICKQIAIAVANALAMRELETLKNIYHHLLVRLSFGS